MKDWIYQTKTGANVGVLELGELCSSNVVFYCHGYPGCRLEASLADKMAQKHQLRIIVLDRAGYGNSSYSRGRQIADFPILIKDIAASLGIQNFSILGVSGGTPYALACASFIPEHLRKCVVVSGVSPIKDKSVFQGMNIGNKILFRLGAVSPFLAGSLIALLGYLWVRNKSFKYLWLKTFMSKSDKNVLKKGRSNSFFEKMNQEAFKQGVRGPRKDFELLCSDWGFELSKIEFPVTVYHGDSDCYVPLAMGKYNASNLKQATLKIVPSEGHLMIVKHLDEILAQFEVKD